jgi:hypothetical protein
MKISLKILLLTLILASCKIRTENKTEIFKSEFNLNTDLDDFKNKMTELDTIKLYINHSVCMYQGEERIEITKKSDSLKIQSEFIEYFLNDNPEWKLIYEKKISVADTIWQFEKFIDRNKKRVNSNFKNYGTLTVKNKQDTIRFYTDGLNDLNNFLIDYQVTMRKLHPENKDNIYGSDFIEE